MTSQNVTQVHIPPERIGNKADLANWFGVALTTIDQWLRRGCPSMQRGERGKPWKFDFLAVAQWKFGGSEDPNLDDPEKMNPKERLDWYRGTRERIAMERDRGELLPADDVAAAWLQQISVAKGRLLALPTRVSSDLLDQRDPREVEQILRRVMTDVLEELASG